MGTVKLARSKDKNISRSIAQCEKKITTENTAVHTAVMSRALLSEPSAVLTYDSEIFLVEKSVPDSFLTNLDFLTKKIKKSFRFRL